MPNLSRFSCVEVTSDAVRRELYFRAKREGLLSFMCYGVDKVTPEHWMEITEPNEDIVFGVCTDQFGAYQGMAIFTRNLYRIWSYDFTAFREAFYHADDVARAGFKWFFDKMGEQAQTVMGITPVVHRHALSLAKDCGFARVETILPKACWYARKRKLVDGAMVLCTRETLAKAMAENKEV